MRPRLPEAHCMQRRKLIDGPFNTLSVSLDQKFLFGWDRNRELAQLWSLDNNEPIATFADFATVEAAASWSKAQRVAFSPNNRWLAYASTNYSIKLRDLQQRKDVF